MRGLLSTQALKYVEKTLGKPIHQAFQGVYGTSTGAIQAAALVHPKPLSAADLERAYVELCTKVFKTNAFSLGGWAGPLYSAEALEGELKRVLGNATMRQARTGFGAVTYNLKTREPWLCSSYGWAGMWDLWAICRASSAAPTFFSPYLDSWIDGGLVANLPSAWAAIDYASHFHVPLSDIQVLAIGTGTTERPIRDAGSRGKLGWVEDVIDIGMSGSQDLEEILCKSLGLKNYLQLQIALPDNAEAMDDTSPEQLLRLKQLGNQMVAQELPRLNAFLSTLLVGQSSAPLAPGT